MRMTVQLSAIICNRVKAVINTVMMRTPRGQLGLFGGRLDSAVHDTEQLL